MTSRRTELDDFEDLEADEDVSLNGHEDADDDVLTMIRRELDKQRETPTIIKILQSTDKDELKMLSEVPRPMIQTMVYIDVIIEARRRLVYRLLSYVDRQRTKYARQKKAFEEDGKLTDDEKSRLDAMQRQVDRRIALTSEHFDRFKNTEFILETAVRSFLLYMRGVDRQGIEEVLRAYIASQADEEGDEVTDE